MSRKGKLAANAARCHTPNLQETVMAHTGTVTAETTIPEKAMATATWFKTQAAEAIPASTQALGQWTDLDFTLSVRTDEVAVFPGDHHP